MDMPQVTDAHRTLHRLAGTWEGQENMEASPWGPAATARGKYVSRVDIDGFNVIQDYVQERDGKVSFRGHGVFTYDARSKEYGWYWVDTTGHVPSGAAKASGWNGNALVFESHSPQGSGRYTFRLEGDSQLEFVLENSFDGGKTWAKLMSGKYRKA